MGLTAKPMSHWGLQDHGPGQEALGDRGAMAVVMGHEPPAPRDPL